MKKIFIITIILIFGKAFSQYPVLSTTSLDDENQELTHTNNGNYAMDTANERDQYLGTWEYNNNGIIFQIKIEKKDKNFNGILDKGVLESEYFYMDEVMIRYKLIINDITKFDSFNEFIPSKIRGSGFKLGQNNYLHGSIVDETTKVGVRYNIFKTNGTSPEKIIFKAQRGTMYKLYPRTGITAPDGTPTFLPMEEIEMVKVN